MRVGRSIEAQEAGGPAAELGVRRRREVASEILRLIGRIGERIRPRISGDVGRIEPRRSVIDANRAVEAKLGGAPGEARGRNVIAEIVAGPVDPARLGRNGDAGSQHLLVVVVARPQHHAVLAECDRLPVVIGRDVPDGQNRHRGPRGMPGSMHIPDQRIRAAPALTAAHRTLPFETRLRVTHVAAGQSARVNDRSPFIPGRSTSRIPPPKCSA